MSAPLDEEIIVAIRVLAWRLDGFLLGERPDLDPEDWTLIEDLAEFVESRRPSRLTQLAHGEAADGQA